MTTNSSTSDAPVHQARPGAMIGRTVVVTGASSGIGAATAAALAGAGGRVGLVGRRHEQLHDVRNAILAAGGTAELAVGDVTDPDSTQQAFALLRRALGPVDVLVANAGVMYPGPITTLARVDWDRQLDVNVGGVLSALQAALPDLVRPDRQGVSDLVIVSSIAAFVAFPTFAVYNASKAAASWLGESLRAELAPQRVRVTTIEPGLTDTRLQSKVGDPDTAAALEDLKHDLAITAADVADVIAFALTRPAGVALPRLVVQPVLQPGASLASRLPLPGDRATTAGALW